MWEVEIIDTGIKNEAIVAQVNFTKGDEVIVRNFAGSTKDEIDGRIAKQLKALEERDANADLVTPGAWSAPVVEKEVKTQEDIEREAWLEQWEAYKKAKEGMDALEEAGIEPTPEEVAGFNALKEWVAANRKKEYTQYL